MSCKFKKTILALSFFTVILNFDPRGLYSQETEPALKKLHLGIVTGANPVKLIKQWRYLLQYLESATGLPVKIVTRENYIDLLEAMEAKDVDLVEGGAYLYTQLHDKAGAGIVVGEIRNNMPYYKAFIITRADKGIGRLEDLKGRTFAFTDPDSTSGYLYPRIMLAEAGIRAPQNFFGSTIFGHHHDIVLDAVLNGSLDAAAIASFFLNELEPKVLKKIKVIAESETIPYGPISYRPGLPQPLVEKIRTALLELNKHATAEQLKEMTVDKFVPVDNKAFDPLRERIKQLEQLPSVNDSIHYRTAPREFNLQIDKVLHDGLILIAVPICALVTFIVILFIAFRYRTASSLKVRLIFAFVSICVVILTTFSASTTLELRTKIKKTADEFLWDLKSFEAGSANAISENRANILAVYTDDFAARQDVVYTKIIRNGEYVTDSRHRDAGRKIADNVLNDTFFLANTLKQPMIEVLDPIVVAGKHWGLVQTGFSLVRIQGMIKRTLAANIITILVATSLSILLAFILSSHITRPLGRLMLAIDNIRRGRVQPMKFEGEDDIGRLARAFEQMRADIQVKDELLQSKMEELDEANRKLKQEFDSIVPPSGIELDELKDKIRFIEERNPKLKNLRGATIIGSSHAFLRTIRDIYIRSQDSDPVLIYGESGVGKTGVAQAIHKLGDRTDRPFGEFNCAEFASADPLIVLGKLFGYGKDTGIQGIQREGRPGLLQEYDGGTIFLDEVASLPPHAQALLLMPLEGRPFNPAAGYGPPVITDTRFIFASNAPLFHEVSQGRFRKDLLRRMRVRGCIDVPPLRQRKEDIPALVLEFLRRWREKTARQMNISPETIKLLQSKDFENFNVGELMSVISIAADNAAFDGKEAIEISHLPLEVRSAAETAVFSGLDSNLEWADEIEAKELTVLRRNRFLIAESEEALGYPKNSKTLTNHFRGICYKALFKEEWQIETAIKLITGMDAATDAAKRVRRKLELYLQGLKESVAQKTEDKLFNNLPQKYFYFIEEATKKFGVS